MKIKCTECKTIYDSPEKYCPYCFNRTNRHDCYNLNSESVRFEGSALREQKTRSNQFNYQKRATSKYKKKKTSAASVISTLFVVFILMFIFTVFLMVFLNLIFFF